MSRRGLLLGLAGVGLSALMPALADPGRPAAEGTLEILATHLAGLPVGAIPPQAQPGLQQVASQLGSTPASPAALEALAQRWPAARDLYRQILAALYAPPQQLAWDAVPFAARPAIE